MSDRQEITAALERMCALRLLDKKSGKYHVSDDFAEFLGRSDSLLRVALHWFETKDRNLSMSIAYILILAFCQGDLVESDNLDDLSLILDSMKGDALKGKV